MTPLSPSGLCRVVRVWWLAEYICFTNYLEGADVTGRNDIDGRWPGDDEDDRSLADAYARLDDAASDLQALEAEVTKFVRQTVPGCGVIFGRWQSMRFVYAREYSLANGRRRCSAIPRRPPDVDTSSRKPSSGHSATGCVKAARSPSGTSTAWRDQSASSSPPPNIWRCGHRASAH